MNTRVHLARPGAIADPRRPTLAEIRAITGDPNVVHVGRSFVGHHLEDGCPCPKEPCGLVADVKVLNCPEHSWQSGKTIRQTHAAQDCPGASEPSES